MRNVVLALLIAGCSSKPEPVEPQPAPEPAPEPAAKEDPPPPAAGTLSLDEKKEIANGVVAMFDEVATAVQANEQDCAAMAAAIDGIATKNADLLARSKKIDGDADEEFKKWFQQTHVQHVQQTMGGAMQSMQKKCGEDQAVRAAFGRLGPG